MKVTLGIKRDMTSPRPTLRPRAERDFLRSIGSALRYTLWLAPERLIRRLWDPLSALLIGVVAAPLMILLVLLTFVIEFVVILAVGLSGRLILNEH